MPPVAADPGWASVAGQTVLPAANSGPQGGMFGGQNTNELLALYERAIAAGMSPSRASQLIGSDIAPEQFLAQIEQLETTRAALGTPAYSPARTAEQTAVRTQAQTQGLLDLQDQLEQQELASQQLTPEQQAIEDRYGHDMAYLDPSFQRSASTVAPVTTQDALQYGTTADPAAQAQERRAIDQLFERANAGPSAGEQESLATQRGAIDRLFQTAAAGPSGGEQFALDTQRSAIDRLFQTADEGATPEERAALEAQSGVSADLIARGRAGATDEERAALADQRRAMGSLFDDYEQGATDVELEAQGAQRRAMDELFGVWEGGGATALERARRAKARAESENWLRGQREADMQDLAERGMSGSGAEIAALARDRQDAASRLSMADLETDAALEERAMQALLSGSGVAGELLAGEGGIQSRRLQQLLGAGGAARGISDTLGNIEGRSTQQLTAGGTMAGDVASGYGSIEERVLAALQAAERGGASMAGTYGDIEARALNALLGANQGAASMTGAYGDIEARALEALLGARAGATDLREGSDRYVQDNADRLFDASTFNAEMIDSAAADNQAFLQQGWRDMLAERGLWARQTRDLQTAVARDLLGSDVQETQFGFGQGYDTAESDTNVRNTAQPRANNAILNASGVTTPAVLDALGGQAQAGTAGLRAGGDTFQQAGSAVATYLSGGMSGMTGMSRQQPTTTQPSRVRY